MIYPEYVAYIKYRENRVIITTIVWEEIECIKDQIFAEQLFGGAK
jgi:hypothetical protein